MSFEDDAWLAKDRAWLAKEKNLLEIVKGERKEELLNQIKQLYFDPDILKRSINWSWSERLVNSVYFPDCCLLSHIYDTNKWLLEHFAEYYGKTPLFVISLYGSTGNVYKFKFGNIFPEVYYEDFLQLYMEHDLFLTNEDLTYLICYTDLQHIVARGEVVHWMHDKLQQLGEDIPRILWNP